MMGLERIARPLAGFDAVIERVGDASIVALGEATHGTHEHYAARVAITRRLFEERGFGALVLEADWPDAYRVSRYVRGLGVDRSAEEALRDFTRFPRWMWRNDDVCELVTWMRAHNERREPRARASVYGMDLYSLHRSMEAVIRYLERVDPEAAERARSRYSCFDRFSGDPELYGHTAALRIAPDCETEAIAELMDMLQGAAVHARRDGPDAREAQFVAEQDALVVKNAERYYRAMFAGHVNTWNERDRHMVETIERVRDHLRATDRPDKVCIWAHNSHLGDARATELGDHGQLNVGQLLRERHGEDAVLVGATTNRGTVTAASWWGGPAERKRVRSALFGSWEQVLSEVSTTPFAIVTADAPEALSERRLNRAIGVVYLPESERVSHYFRADLARQFDVVLHFHESSAVRPLERWSRLEADVGETYPFGV